LRPLKASYSCLLWGLAFPVPGPPHGDIASSCYPPDVGTCRPFAGVRNFPLLSFQPPSSPDLLAYAFPLRRFSFLDFFLWLISRLRLAHMSPSGRLRRGSFSCRLLSLVFSTFDILDGLPPCSKSVAEAAGRPSSSEVFYGIFCVQCSPPFKVWLLVFLFQSLS